MSTQILMSINSLHMKDYKMNVLVGCEYSDIVASAFRKVGHYVLSCDLEPNDSPNSNHYQGDVLDVLNYNWDLLIGFPSCQYLAKCGLHHCIGDDIRSGLKSDAVAFFKSLYYCKIKRVALENPSGALTSLFRPPDQIYHPWHFGSSYRKETGLWLKNVPPLIQTVHSTNRKSMVNHVNSRMSQALKSKVKSRFFPEVASAMANQWSSKCLIHNIY